MKYIQLLFLLVLMSITAGLSAQDSVMMARQNERKILLTQFQAHKDTMTIRTFVNVVALNGKMESLIKADSALLEYYNKRLYELSDRLALEDTIQNLKAKIKDLRIIQKSSNIMPAPLSLIFLLVVFALFILGLIAYVFVLRRKRKVIKVEDESDEQDLNYDVVIANYDRKLEEISKALSDITREREKTLTEMESLNKALISEKQQSISFSEQYERLSEQYRELQRKVNESNALNDVPSDAKNNLQIKHLEEKYLAELKLKGYEIETLKAQIQKSKTASEQLELDYQSKLEIAEKQINEMTTMSGNLRQQAGNYDALREEAQSTRTELEKFRAKCEGLEKELSDQKQKMKFLETDIHNVLKRFGN